MKKKILSLLLVIILCLTMLPASVFATDGGGGGSYILSNAADDTTSDDATAGDDSADSDTSDDSDASDDSVNEGDVSEDADQEDFEDIFVIEPILFVAGVEVNPGNAEDILGDGKVKFDYYTNTLTLTDATIKNTEGDGIYAENIDLTVHGVDTAKAGKNDITGTDVVIIDTEDEYEAENHGAIVVENGSLVVTGTIGDIYSQSVGISGISGVEIKGTVGDFYLKDGRGPEFPVDGIRAAFGPVTISGTVGDIIVDGTTIESGEGDLTISGTVGRLAGMDVLRSSGGDIFVSGSIESIDIGNSYYAGGAAISAYSYPEFDDEGEIINNVGGNVTLSGKIGVINGNACGIWADGNLIISGTDITVIAHDEYDVYGILVGGEILVRSTMIVEPEDYTIEYYDYGEGLLYKTLADKNGKIATKVKFGTGDKECDGTGPCPGNGFDDVDTAEWYHKAVDYALENGLMNGVGNNLFNVSGTTNRAMIVTMLWRLEGSPEVETEVATIDEIADLEESAPDTDADSADNTTSAVPAAFTDVPDGEWYAAAVKWAAENKIVEGLGEGVFGPLNPVTREQLATILYRYSTYKKADLSAGESTDLSTFVDSTNVSSWAAAAVKWAVGEKIISGKGNNDLVPGGYASRVETAQMFMNFLTR